MLKTIYTLLFAALPGALLEAQLTLEHTYPNHPISNRTDVPGAGERYYRSYKILSSNTAYIEWFDGAHEPAGTVAYDLLPTIDLFIPLNFTANFFDNDPGIEFRLTQRDSVSGLIYYSIFDDDGSPLTGFFRFPPQLVTLGDGATKKMIVADTVYKVPELTVEQILPSGGRSVRPVRLEDFGDKYWWFEPDGTLRLYNANYTPFAAYATGYASTGCSSIGLDIFGQYKINGDPAVEWMAYFNCADTFVLRYFSGSALLSEYKTTGTGNSTATTLLPTTFPDLNTAKGFVSYLNGATVVDAATGLPEHNYNASWTFRSNDGAGLKYVPVSIPAGQTAIPVFDAGHTLWASFPKPDSATVSSLEPGTTFFDNDPSDKELFGRFAFPNFVNSMRVVREDGSIYFQLDSFSSAIVSKLPGLQNKLIINSFGAFKPAQCRVYSLPSSTPSEVNAPAGPPSLHFGVFPNPTASEITLDLRGLICSGVRLEIYDAKGQLVARQDDVPSGDLRALPGCAQWKSGMYWIKIACNAGYGWQAVVKE